MAGGKKPLRPFQCSDSACIFTSEIIDNVTQEKFQVWLKSVDFLLVILGTDKPAKKKNCSKYFLLKQYNSTSTSSGISDSRI